MLSPHEIYVVVYRGIPRTVYLTENEAKAYLLMNFGFSEDKVSIEKYILSSLPST